MVSMRTHCENLTQLRSRPAARVEWARATPTTATSTAFVTNLPAAQVNLRPSIHLKMKKSTPKASKCALVEVRWVQKLIRVANQSVCEASNCRLNWKACLRLAELCGMMYSYACVFVALPLRNPNLAPANATEHKIHKCKSKNKLMHWNRCSASNLQHNGAQVCLCCCCRNFLLWQVFLVQCNQIALQKSYCCAASFQSFN